MKTNKGLTIYLVIGKWAKPKLTIFKDGFILRICLGFVAFVIAYRDIETYVVELHQMIEKLIREN